MQIFRDADDDNGGANIFSGEYILRLWLEDVAPYTIGFMKLVLAMAFIDSMVGPITTALQATGRIKWFQITIFIILAFTIPAAYIWLKCDANPYVVLYVSICASIAALAARIILLHNEIRFSYRKFLTSVVARVYASLAASAVSAWLLFPLFTESIVGMTLFVASSALVSCGWAIALGLDSSERRRAMAFMARKIRGYIPR